MNSADPQARAKEIENFIASNELDAATKRLMDFTTDFSTNRKRKWEVIAIRQQYSQLSEYKRIYGESYDFYNREIRRLIEQILEFMDLIIDEYNQADYSLINDSGIPPSQVKEILSEQLNDKDKKTRYEIAKEIFLAKQRLAQPTTLVLVLKSNLEMLILNKNGYLIY